MENDLCEIRGEVENDLCEIWGEVLHPAFLFGASLASCKLFLCQWPWAGLLHLLLLEGRMLLRNGALLWLWVRHRDLLALLLLLGTWYRVRVLDGDHHWDLFALLLLLGTWCRLRLLNRFWHRDLLAFLLLLGTGYRLRVLDRDWHRDLLVLLLLLRTLCRFRRDNRDLNGDLLALLLLLGDSFGADRKDWLWKLFAC